MERLTKSLPDGKTVMDCDSCEQKKDKQCTFYECRASLIKRLAAYEDTGLTPERCAEFARADAEGRYIVMRDAEQEGVARLRELAEADKAGRLVVLPCRQGDELWTYCDHPIKRVYSFTVSDVSTMNGRTVLNTLGLGTIRPEDIGKTVFRTREEAERAMEGET